MQSAGHGLYRPSGPGLTQSICSGSGRVVRTRFHDEPLYFKWILRAKEKGATIIHVDPRYTRTSARCDFHVPLRSGTDIAFLGGMIHYIIENNKYFKDYVLNYTNASFIVGADYDFKDGLFSGYDAKKRKYDKATWVLEKDGSGIPKRDMTLANPRSVFQMMRKHYSRYTLDKVSSITGVSKENLLKVYEIYSATGVPDKAGTECYALGWTHHTTGSQNIRTMSIIQLLLGNMGIAGGGINALRGEPNVQGSTDHAILYNVLPGYLKTPSASLDTLDSYLKKYTPESKDPQSANYYQNYPKFFVSFLKSYWEDKATKENEFGYSWLPKMEDGKHYSTMHLFDKMYEGSIKGFFAIGADPAVSTPNSNKVRKALQNLEWLVGENIFNNETYEFWRGPGVDPTKNKTECFLLPAAATMEKEGSQSNSGRWVQWKYKACDPPGDALPVGEIEIKIMAAVKKLYEKEGGPNAEAIVNLKWDYLDGKGHMDVLEVAKRINGVFLEDTVIEDKAKGTKTEFKKGQLVPGFGNLQLDGKTACGNWCISGSYTADGLNKMASRGKEDPTGLGLFPNWAYAWPVNRRIMYNRASCDVNGKPYNPKRNILEWKGDKWVGDVPDGPWPPQADKEKGKYPFIMQKDGLGALFGPGMAEGPFPEHYEPLEGPLSKNPLSGQLMNPAAEIFKSDMDKVANASEKFPYVCTTYSCTEHWCTGALTRWQAWLLEMQPELYVEIGDQLAKEKGIKNGQRIKVSSIRGEAPCIAMVTKRFKPFTVEGKTVHQVGMPFNYGWLFPKDSTSDSTNMLTPTVGDANTFCPEYKAFMVNVEKL
ncbi:MAG: formate dehydrogenase-N subunit alpha [Deltaproteobacteria bacterium HGW-Deltaproteobacteria-5]|nr:MAG: formate dehydrogenase-N subunit alpha [Deltaproteobacteria bacterium HGW-Deltaproteobacteria-5]